jgi:hypothetical protein
MLQEFLLRQRHRNSGRGARQVHFCTCTSNEEHHATENIGALTLTSAVELTHTQHQRTVSPIPAASEVGQEDNTSGTCYSTLSWSDMADCGYAWHHKNISYSPENKGSTCLINATWYVLISILSSSVLEKCAARLVFRGTGFSFRAIWKGRFLTFFVKFGNPCVISRIYP